MSANLNTTLNLDEVIRELREKAMESTDPSIDIAINVPELKHGNNKIEDGYIISFDYLLDDGYYSRGYYLSVTPGYIERTSNLGEMIRIDLSDAHSRLLNKSTVIRKSKFSRNEALANLDKSLITDMLQKCHENIMNRRNNNN